MPQRKSRKRTNGKRGRNAVILPNYQPVRVPNYRYMGMPPEQDCKLQYTFSGVIGTGSTSALKIFNPNTYIPENSGTLAPAQYVEWAAFYDHYRVVKTNVKVEFVNNDTQAVNVALVLTTETISGGLFTDYANNAFAKTALLGSANGGASKARLSLTSTVAKLTGNAGAATADSFKAVINANPADVIWASVGAQAPATMTNGITVTVKVVMWFKFFSMNFVTEQVPPSPQGVIAYKKWQETRNVQYYLDYIHFSRHKSDQKGLCSCGCGQNYRL